MFEKNPPIPGTTNHDWLSEAEEKSFELLKTKYEKAPIDMAKFEKIDGYGKNRVERDRERVKRKKRDIQESGTGPTRKAQLLEALLTEQIELSNWFGENTYTIIPAEFDDLFHGVDLALEIEDEGGVKHLALGIDVTSSAKSITKKLRETKERLLRGELTSMEYFHSEDHNPEFYGTMSNIPWVIVGTEGKTIKELGELWMSAFGLAKLRRDSKQPPLSPESEASQIKSSREARQKLADHRAQTLMLEEIKMQLTVFCRFAKEKGLPEIADKLSSTLELVTSILSSKETPSIDDVFKNQEDFVFQALTEALNDFDNL